MGIKDQLRKVKENWLIAVLLIIVVLIPLLGNYDVGQVGDFFPELGIAESADYALKGSVSSVRPGYYPKVQDGFAPDVQDRKITKTVSLTTEVEQGQFKDAEQRPKAIIASSEALLLNENVYKHDTGRKGYYQGTYYLKVEVQKYAAVVSQVREIGEIQYFTENVDDVTESHTNLKTELEAERARLQRYREMLAEATEIQDKLELSDRIFNQERTVKYLEDALKNIDERVEYSTISITLQEKRSDYADIVFVKFSELVEKLVDSVNGVLTLVMALLPYALAVVLVWWGVRKVRGSKR